MWLRQSSLFRFSWLLRIYLYSLQEEDNNFNVKAMITQLIWTIWTSLSVVPRKAIKLNHSLTGRSNILPRHISLGNAWHLVHIRSMLKYSTYMIINIDSIPHKLDYMVPEPTSYNMLMEYSQNHFIPQSNDCALQLCLFCADPSVSNLLYWNIYIILEVWRYPTRWPIDDSLMFLM